ncbi:large ribosomal subunit protein uL15m [Tribolium castaneum]|uniref:Large ribosomal subunit protein uL15m n=1 Tax=Tribolium castaneum TaxID=7070 RepID=D6WM14_TRICA|nr:PREDICTED: 39S ribosomal protein L15, mitochondrial [Tribolium castaneum]EFA04204.1 39S ribosomal protein L15, mitochondrial-like Protein [Tribolium castaneum]|eukprot:XP_974883.1 PREDICTED: 39S ribosomal protein L15, mitochondrial [Tribolium castaneum]
MGSNTAEKALQMLKFLPRVCLANLKPSPGSRTSKKRGRGQHGGDKHGAGNKGSGQRQNYMRLGYETGNNPFYLRFPHEPYYQGHHLRREYPPLSMLDLLKLIEMNRLDASKPIDLVSILNTGLYKIFPDQRQYGVNLTDEGADVFNAKVNIEVQWATEPVIAAIERAGGVITTAYYDQHSLQAMINAKKFFERGVPIPRRMMPPPDAIEYYADPTKRGYLADPEKISEERLVLAQKYGYELPQIEKDPEYEMLTERKDPRQIFYGLHPGWVVNLKDKVILKPQDEELERYYAS